jgi:uncharacterized membrane protein YeaQ/YmgE (transglycosylase-associated protein family)
MKTKTWIISAWVAIALTMAWAGIASCVAPTIANTATGSGLIMGSFVFLLGAFFSHWTLRNE